MKQKHEIADGREMRFGSVYALNISGQRVTFRPKKSDTPESAVSVSGSLHMGHMTHFPLFGGGRTVRGANGRWMKASEARLSVSVNPKWLLIAYPSEVAQHNAK